MTETASQPTTKRFTIQTLFLLLIPVILLGGVIALFLSTGGGLDLEAPVPVENLTVERYYLERNKIELNVQNTGPEELTIASVIIVNRYAASGLAVGGLFIARALPPFLFGPMAGVVADRFDRRNVLIASDLLWAAIVLGFLLVDRPERLWLLYLLTVLQFSVSAFFEPARAALVPALVKSDELITANTLASIT